MTYKVHPHEKMIRKWLDGAQQPSWFHSLEYRVKPKESINIVKYVSTWCYTSKETAPILHYTPCEQIDATIKLTYSPTGLLIDVSKV